MQHRNLFNAALLSLSTLLLTHSPAVLAADSTQDHSIPTITSGSPDAEALRKDLEKLLVSFEHDWNSHNLEAVMAYYADDYFNNDGFDKKTIQQLTQELWKAYPDIKSTSLTKQIRIEGPYATVESKDEATGNTAEEMVGLGTKGELKSTSEGQLYLKHLGTRWRIIGDRIDFEKISVGYGLARQLQPVFAAPEQVKGGKQFTARLEVDLPTGLAASGAISQATVSFPLSRRIPDKYKPIGDAITDRPLLERVMVANTKNRNELLTASIGLTNASGNSLMGALTLTRRLNVIPTMEAEEVTTASAEPGKSSKTDEPGSSTK